MDFTTRPVELISNFRQILSEIRTIRISPHAMDHLSERQRKIFKENELIAMLKREKPRRVYLQKNGRYAAYFRRADGYRKLILEISGLKLTVVTFMDVAEVQRL